MFLLVSSTSFSFSGSLICLLIFSSLIITFCSITGCPVVFIVHSEIDVFYKFVSFLSSLSMFMVIVLFNLLFATSRLTA